MPSLRNARTSKQSEVGLCACGCGGVAPTYPTSTEISTSLRGTYRRFISGHNRTGKGVPFSDMWKLDASTGCWLWQGAVSSNGYGMLSHKGKATTAHRVSYELHVGPIPSRQLVLHSCDTKLCVNPKHLSCGTHSKNMQEAWDRGLRNRQYNYSHLLKAQHE